MYAPHKNIIFSLGAPVGTLVPSTLAPPLGKILREFLSRTKRADITTYKDTKRKGLKEGVEYGYHRARRNNYKHFQSKNDSFS
jgi:hypothetical protein